MRHFFSLACYMLIGLLLGAMFSSHISMEMALTDWSNMWVWMWVFLWPVMVMINMGLIFVVVIVVVGIGMLVHAAGKEWGWW